MPIPPTVDAVLVDPTGARCYERATVRYAAEGIDVSGGGPPARFDRALVHPVGLVDVLLTPPPESVTGDAVATRIVLAERRCGRAR